MPTIEEIRACLAQVKYPGYTRDIVDFGFVKKIEVSEKGEARVEIQIGKDDGQIAAKIKADCQGVLAGMGGLKSCEVDVQTECSHGHSHSHQGAGELPPVRAIEGVRRIIAVASGKGGVGKSTVAANLACALKMQGHRVGLCDCDIYGPSMGLMFGKSEAPYATAANRIVPVESHGIRLMSMGFLVDDETPAILRGPMISRFVQQFLYDVEWGILDALVLDLPPGTGDVQLTIVQSVPLAGAVIVTTPQEMALIDARKAAAMFHKVGVRILGLVENMSYFACPSDGVRYPIFGEGGGRREAGRLNVPLLGEIPIDLPTRESGDSGMPIVVREPESEVTRAFLEAASKMTQAWD